MKECEQISDLFGELHDNQVEDDISKSFHKHLHNCTNCRENFMWYGITIQALSGLERVSPPEDFLTQLNARLHPSSSSSFLEFFRSLFSSAPYMPLPVGVASLALIVVIGFVIYNSVPGEVLPPTPSLQSLPNISTMRSAKMPIGGMVTASESTHSTAPTVRPPLYAMSTPQPVESSLEVVGRPFPTIADTIGADNLTVESSSVDQAVESLKKILPNIQGRLVDEKARGGIGEIVVSVLIPSDAYGDLTTELINHGAVAAGAGSDITPPSRAKKDGNNVLLFIRFVHTR